MDNFLSLVKWDDPYFLFCFASIAFAPIMWNIVARREHRTRFLTNFFGSPYTGCYLLAAVIFSLGLERDWSFNAMMDHQATIRHLFPADQREIIESVSYVLFGIGTILVVSSFWALGVTGTYLGDYFGILMDAKVEGFPFNVVNDPMYTGATLNFFAAALYKFSPAGLVMTVWVHIVYKVALAWEGEFTNMIYAGKAERDQAKKK